MWELLGDRRERRRRQEIWLLCRMGREGLRGGEGSVLMIYIRE